MTEFDGDLESESIKVAAMEFAEQYRASVRGSFTADRCEFFAWDEDNNPVWRVSGWALAYSESAPVSEFGGMFADDSPSPSLQPSHECAVFVWPRNIGIRIERPVID